MAVRSPAGSETRLPVNPGDASNLLLVPSKRQRLSDELYGQIFDQIVSGRIKEGEKLPPETEICRMFNVSRPTVREALLRLRSDGLINARPGAGTRVLSRPSERFRMFLSSTDVARYLRGLELRVPIETTAARLAAQRRTREQIVQLEKVHRDFCAKARRGIDDPDADVAFHCLIAQSTANEFVQEFVRKLHKVLGGAVIPTRSVARTASRERAVQVMAEHARIVEAIRFQDEEGAETAMRFHLSQARRRLIDRGRDE